MIPPLALLLAGCTTIQTQVEIAAPATEVRAVLYNFGAYPAWNPFIVRVAGVVAPGDAVTVTVRPVGRPEISGKTTVTAFSDHDLAWTGGLAFPGVFTGHHDFRIEAEGPDRTVFHNDERMSGLAVAFYDLGPVRAGFEAMNVALKRQVEATAPAPRP
jgi:hypothetical protein